MYFSLVKLKRNFNGWSITSLLLVALLSVPLWILLFRFFDAKSEVWDHLFKTVLKDYVYNTAVVLVGVGALVLLIGISTAWLIAVYDFPGKKIFSWALVLPLAIPSYVGAYTYAGIFDYTSPVSSYAADLLGIKNAYADIMTMQNLILILGFVMYPYIYLVARASFVHQSGNVLEASRLLGKSSMASFFSIALPLARPALAAGLSLVVMELLNDYGAMIYFGVNTFTTAICQIWFSFNDINAAIKLAICLMIVCLLFIGLEKLLRGKSKFYNNASKLLTHQPKKLKGTKAGLAFLICFLPILLGFIVPIAQLGIWTFQTAAKELNAGSWQLVKNSFLLATVASILAVVIALLIVYSHRLSKGKLMKILLKIVNSGYAIPGAVVAIGVMIPYIFIHNALADSMGRDYDIMNGLLVGGVIALVFSYLVRFMALSVNPIESGFEKMNKNLEEASKNLGASYFKTLFKINIPMLKVSLAASAIFVFVNVLKEIPLTMILRPFNFDTLAVKSFEMAKNEMVQESASLSMIIVLVSIIPVIILNKLFDKRKA